MQCIGLRRCMRHECGEQWELCRMGAGCRHAILQHAGCPDPCNTPAAQTCAAHPGTRPQPLPPSHSPKHTATTATTMPTIMPTLLLPDPESPSAGGGGATGV